MGQGAIAHQFMVDLAKRVDGGGGGSPHMRREGCSDERKLQSGREYARVVRFGNGPEVLDPLLARTPAHWTTN